MKNRNNLGIKYLKKVGKLELEELYTPVDGKLLFSLDIDDWTKPEDLKKWYLHICFARGKSEDHSHDHYLLSVVQARKLQKFIDRYLEVHDSVKKKTAPTR